MWKDATKYELVVGDTVQVHNGYGWTKATLTEHDLRLCSVPNGMHSERASLTDASYGFRPLVWVDEEELEEEQEQEETWQATIPINVVVKDLDYVDGKVSFTFDEHQVGEEVGKFILDAVTRAAEGVLNES